MINNRIAKKKILLELPVSGWLENSLGERKGEKKEISNVQEL